MDRDGNTLTDDPDKRGTYMFTFKKPAPQSTEAREDLQQEQELQPLSIEELEIVGGGAETVIYS